MKQKQLEKKKKIKYLPKFYLYNKDISMNKIQKIQNKIMIYIFNIRKNI